MEGRINLSLSLKEGRVLIFRDVFKALDNPGCFRFLINEDTNQLAIQVCAFGDSGFHMAPDYSEKASNWSYRIHSQEMLELLWDLCDWEPELTYRVGGVICPDIHVIVFELNEAEVINDIELDAEAADAERRLAVLEQFAVLDEEETRIKAETGAAHHGYQIRLEAPALELLGHKTDG